MIPGLVLLFAASPMVVTSYAQQADAPPPEVAVPEAGDFPRKLQTSHLVNPVQLNDRVISGGLPDGEAAFRELYALGVRTMISVDGAKPDWATAERCGLRYIHLPHGYNGISTQRILELARAVHDAEGVVFIHCHHGKHRSPAAAGAACVAAGMLTAQRAVAVLELAGTSPSYRGLYETVRDTKTVSVAELDAVDVNFRRVSQIPPMAESMVELEHTFDLLQKIADNDWQPLPNTRTDAAHEALLLREHYTELLRTEHVLRCSPAFREQLTVAERTAESLHSELAGQSNPPESESKVRAKSLLLRLRSQCRSCHQEFRDSVPVDHTTR
ncbi:MAG: hypothetical protein R3C49_21530 [Planctomycetaceae bacterium]